MTQKKLLHVSRHRTGSSWNDNICRFVEICMICWWLRFQLFGFNLEVD